MQASLDRFEKLRSVPPSHGTLGTNDLVQVALALWGRLGELDEDRVGHDLECRAVKALGFAIPEVPERTQNPQALCAQPLGALDPVEFLLGLGLALPFTPFEQRALFDVRFEQSTPLQAVAQHFS